MLKQIAKLEANIAKTKKKLIDDSAELEGLLTQRAQFIVDGKNVKHIDQQIAELRTNIDGMPSVIDIYQKGLVEARRKLAVEDRDKLLDNEKVAVAKAMKLSRQLVAQLAAAVDTNKELHVAYVEYKKLHEMTNVDLLGDHFAEPSHGMLEFLFGFLKGELKDGIHCRTMLKEPPQI